MPGILGEKVHGGGQARLESVGRWKSSGQRWCRLSGLARFTPGVGYTLDTRASLLSFLRSPFSHNMNNDHLFQFFGTLNNIPCAAYCSPLFLTSWLHLYS